MPPVALALVPVVGAPLVTAQPDVPRALALTINAIGLGSGIFMYLALLALAFGWLAWALLAGIWSLTLVKTIAGVASGTLFQPHP